MMAIASAPETKTVMVAACFQGVSDAPVVDFGASVVVVTPGACVVVVKDPYDPAEPSDPAEPTAG